MLILSAVTLAMVFAALLLTFVLHQSLERGLRDEIARNREELARSLAEMRAASDQLRGAVDQKLELVRQSVEEKLQTTLDQRLGASFQRVSQSLEQVHRGLGEMQTLAASVGDLKKVLANVKTRGTWGEVQLGALIEQMLTPEQYERNVATTGTGERVEYAVKLPGSDESGTAVWLPIDAKFPQEDYQRLVEASERGDPEALEAAARQLELRVRQCARDIHDKYVLPPRTTDFAILFLPTESLYAELLRRPGLADAVQQQYRVMIAGPATLGALLNSLQLGFRTLVIQKRTSEVWKVLGEVKTEFGRYADLLARVEKKLQEAGSVVEDAAVRTRAINRKLRDVESADSASG